MNTPKKIANWYFSKNMAPYWCIVLIDSTIVVFSFLLIYWLFRRSIGVAVTAGPLILTTLIFLAVSLIFFKVFRTYSGIIRFSSFTDLERIAEAMACSAIVVYALHFATNLFPTVFVPLLLRHIVLTYLMATFLMWIVRLLVKTFYDSYYMTEHATRSLIYGTMDGGVALAKEITSEKPLRYNLCGFITHDPSLKNALLKGKKVYPSDENIGKVLNSLDIRAVLVSPKRVENFRKDTRLQDAIIASGAKIYMVSKIREWDGSTPKQVLKEVSVEDLLPREEIKVDLEGISGMLKGKRILITGCAGSIGGEIVRQVCEFAPAELMLVDQAETPLHDMRLFMRKYYPQIKASTVVTSITDADHMEVLFQESKPEYVFHAAAYKHVPMMEDNPGESIYNNVYGTKVVADLSVKYGVKKFVMISTDKAVNPTSVMGCSKRLCEIYVQSLNMAELNGKVKGETQFVTTRFGNVLGSNGSVIPLFKQQIRDGGPVTVTDPNIVRFFMLIPEACKLVLEAGAMGKGGEIFVFDMGAPVRIADLAKRMILMSGATGIDIKYTGLRDGEKLYEEVLASSENSKPSSNPKIRIASVREYDFDEVKKVIDSLIDLSHTYDDFAIVSAMEKIVPEYHPNNARYEVKTA